jgi:hypothetical protein
MAAVTPAPHLDFSLRLASGQVFALALLLLGIGPVQAGPEAAPRAHRASVSATPSDGTVTEPQPQARHEAARASRHPAVPLPRPRPLDRPRDPVVAARGDAAEPEVPVGPPMPAPSACQIRLSSDVAAFELLPAINGPGECRVDEPVKLEAVILADKSRVAVRPAATLRCGMAEAIANWVRSEAVSITAGLGSPIRAIAVEDSFDCRERNRVPGAKISEHGFGNALDISSITLANGRTIGLTDIMVDKPLRERLRESVCARFTTVLGPGSDGYHESHVHLDLADRRGGYRMCQWAVRDVNDLPPPMPRERPPEAPPRAAGDATAD